MKQFTTEQQTAKLIELGFEKPKSSVECELPKGDWRIGAVGIRKAYSIGELYEIISNRTIPMQVHCEKGGFDLPHITLKVYIDGMWCIMLDKRNVELIDFLFDALVQLKEEGVI